MTLTVHSTITLKINPISTNTVIQKTVSFGRNKKRYQEYRSLLEEWAEKVNLLLPDGFLPDDMTGYGLFFEMGIIRRFDLDNTLKFLIDTLQDRYGFNDSQISYLGVKKTVVKGTRDQRNQFVKISLTEGLELNNQDAVDHSNQLTMNPSLRLKELRDLMSKGVVN